MNSIGRKERTGHSDDSAHSLAAFDDDELLLRRGTGEHNFGVVPEDLVQLVGVQFPEFGSVDDGGFGLARIDFGYGDIQPLSNVLDGLVTWSQTTFPTFNSLFLPNENPRLLGISAPLLGVENIPLPLLLLSLLGDTLVSESRSRGIQTFGDDADRFGNGFGSDRMVTGYHDDLDAG